MVKNHVQFIATSSISIVSAVISLIVLCVAAFSTKFYRIDNTSGDPEIYSIFRKIDFNLFGHCTTIDTKTYCNTVTIGEMFTHFPSIGSFPISNTPQQFVDALRIFKGNCPFVFIPIIGACAFIIIALMFSSWAITCKTRKSVIITGVFMMISNIFSIVALTVSDLIYKRKIPELLKRTMTVQVLRNNELVDIKGPPSEIGIKGDTLNGIQMLVVGFIFSLISVCVCARWWFEADAPRKKKTENAEMMKELGDDY